MRLWSGEVSCVAEQEGGLGSGCEISFVRRPLRLLPLRCRPRGAKSGARASCGRGAVGEAIGGRAPLRGAWRCAEKC